MTDRRPCVHVSTQYVLQLQFHATSMNERGRPAAALREPFRVTESIPLALIKLPTARGFVDDTTL